MKYEIYFIRTLFAFYFIICSGNISVILPYSQLPECCILLVRSAVLVLYFTTRENNLPPKPGPGAWLGSTGLASDSSRQSAHKNGQHPEELRLILRRECRNVWAAKQRCAVNLVRACAHWLCRQGAARAIMQWLGARRATGSSSLGMCAGPNWHWALDLASRYDMHTHLSHGTPSSSPQPLADSRGP